MQNNKPTVFSKAFKFILLIAVGILIAVLFHLAGVSKWITIIVVLALYIVITIVQPMYTIYLSRSLKALNRYVVSNYKKPIFGYSYALAHGDKEDIEKALKRIMDTYPQQDMRDVYGANLAIFKRDSSALLTHANNIVGQEYKDYYSGHAYVMTGNFDKASEFLAKLQTPWMIRSLKAYTALKQGNKDIYADEMNRAIHNSMGMQRYVLHHTMKRYENGDFKA